MTRRSFLKIVGGAGGAGAVLGALNALGLLAPAPGLKRFRLSGPGRGRKILILGGGLAGLATAYELGKVGYACRILEARDRPGGRCRTIRRGDIEAETDGHSQVAAFDDGLYFNSGAARIPQQHVTLDYCRELGVAIEAFGNVNESAFLYNEGVGALSGRRVRLREAKMDLHGYTAELLAKAIHQNELDAPLTPDDRARLLAFLRADGGLTSSDQYTRSDRRGFRELPGAGARPGVIDDPLALSALLRSGFGAYLPDENVFDWQMMMFQIVGGSDNLPRAFASRLGPVITSGARVQEIRQGPSEARVVYADASGHAQEATGEYCICTIPLSVLRTIPADFSPAMTQAIGGVGYAPVCKIGLQFARRFWEEDDRIFSGITRTNLSIAQIFYPSSGYLSKNGILVGCYNHGRPALEMGDLTPEARAALALAEGAKIHPQYPREYQTSFSAAWHKTPAALGGWAAYTPETRRDLYPVLNKPDGRIYLAGEHLTYLTGWMAGALESARTVAAAVHERASRDPTPHPAG